MSKKEKKPTLEYKNVSQLTQSVIGIGEVKPGQIIKVDEPFENPNFEQVRSK